MSSSSPSPQDNERRARKTIFEGAAKIFDGWQDKATGARVLRIDHCGKRDRSAVWQTAYQQCRCFLDGGVTVLLRTNTWSRHGGDNFTLLNLITGERIYPFPDGWTVVDVSDKTHMATLLRNDKDMSVSALYDLNSGRILAQVEIEGWKSGGIYALGDGSQAIVSHFRGRPHNEPVDSHFHLLTAEGTSNIILEARAYYCNHVQGCPSDPNLYSYDRWPAPRRDVEQVIHIASLDGSVHHPAPLDENAIRPDSMLGVRDHYIWTPDGSRIVSYLNPESMNDPTPTMGCHESFGKEFNHFNFPWVLSALDWQSGEDLAASYPPGRWGCHMAVTPDSRHIISAGGPGFDFLYAVDIEGLREGWNEHIICAYPETVSIGTNSDPFAFPVVLPDGSGVLFNAGWPGSEHGLYLAELSLGSSSK